jgi:hypothetical protein
MASPQVENGALQVALELQDAIMRSEFTGLERRVLDAIMRYTYAAGKSKAEITAEDVRLMIEGDRRVRTDRIDAVLVKLEKQNVLTCQPWNGNFLRGIQKNYDVWFEQQVDKMSSTINGIVINNTNSRRVLDKMSTSVSNPTEPELLVAYSQEQSGLIHSIPVWRTERSWAVKLLKKVLAKTNDPIRAKQLIRDYIDENEWMRQNVQRQFAFMYPRFDQWLAQIPRKPREIQESEEAIGRRYRYNVKSKNWEVTKVPPQAMEGL